MTTLLQRCQMVATKVEQLSLAQRHANQQMLVQQRSQEWKSRYDKLKAMQARLACLALNAEAGRRVADKRAHLRHNAAEVLERLKANDDIAELTADTAWTRLLACVEGLTEELEASGQEAWKSFLEEQGTPETPDWLRRAPPTPTNVAVIAAYERHYRAHASLVKLALPRNADDLVNLSQVVVACRTEAAKIDFKVPPDVQAFFHAVQWGSATLASVTPDVLEWLAEHSQLDCYQIRSTGQ